MGIQNLLPLMKDATTKIKLSKLSGSVAVVDTNGWIHRACFNCGDKVYMGEETQMYIEYCMNMCKVFKKNNITPLLIFDGQALPAKNETRKRRKERKDKTRAEIEKLLKQGKTREARGLMRTAVDVTFEMCRKVMLRCREEGIDYILAPFEADSQMVYMVTSGIADFAVSEDSDLLVFGCPKLLTKFDRDSETGQMITLSKLQKCFPRYNHLAFQFLCILAGCDYLSNIANFGMGRARKFVDTLNLTKFDQTAVPDILKSIPKIVKVNKMGEVSDDYVQGFIRAYLAFTHQLIYCPIRKVMTHLKPLPSSDLHKEWSLGEFAGEFFENQTVEYLHNYVRGNIHCKTLEIVEESPESDQMFSEVVQKRIKCSNGLISNSISTVLTSVKKQEIESDTEEVILIDSPVKKTVRKTQKKRTMKTEVTHAVEIKRQKIEPDENKPETEILSKTTSRVVRTTTRVTRNCFKKSIETSNGARSSSYFRSTSVDSVVTTDSALGSQTSVE